MLISDLRIGETPPDGSRWHTRHDREARNIPGDHAARRDDGSSTDTDTGKNYRPEPDPNVILNNRQQPIAPRRSDHAHADMLIFVSIASHNPDLGCKHHIPANENIGRDKAARTNCRTIADLHTAMRRPDAYAPLNTDPAACPDPAISNAEVDNVAHSTQ